MLLRTRHGIVVVVVDVIDSDVRLVVADATQVLPASTVSWRHLATEVRTVARWTTVIQLQGIS